MTGRSDTAKQVLFSFLEQPNKESTAKSTVKEDRKLKIYIVTNRRDRIDEIIVRTTTMTFVLIRLSNDRMT